MRKILIILIIVPFSLAIYAQSDYRDAFMSNWIWYNNIDTFRIKFKKAIFHIDRDIPGLYGYHEYKSGNKVLESSLKDYDKDISMKLYTIRVFWWYEQEKPNNIVTGRISDVEYRDNMYMRRSLQLTLSPDKKSMQFEARDRERLVVIIEGTNQNPNTLLPKDRKTFFFPKEAVFIKEEDMHVAGLPPLPMTGSFSNISFYTATLHGSINPNSNKNTTAYFEYGTTTAYSKRVDAVPAAVSGNTPISVSANISELTANNTTYHYRLVSIANGKTYYGEDQSFRTLYDAPTMQRLREVAIGSQSATLAGEVHAHNLGQCYVYIEYNSTNNPNTIKKVNANTTMIVGDMNTPFTADLKGLLPSNQYRCRIVCTIGDKTYYGAYFSFTTAYKQGHFEYEKDKQ